MDSTGMTAELPDRSDTDIPPQVRLLLSIAEITVGWAKWQREHHDEPRAYFYEGIFDYWWDGALEEPTWEMIFYKDLSSGELRGVPPRERFYYQQGAIVGYQLREEYKYNKTDN